MVKVAIYFACYKRLPVLKIFLDGLERIKRENKDIKFLPFAVYTGKAEGDLLKKYKIRSLKFPNKYLGRKKNAGLKELMKLEWDYLLELGSDDLISSNLIKLYKPYWKAGENCFGVNSCYFVESSTGRVAYWSHDYAIGAGRCIKRTVFNGFNERVKVRYLHSISGDVKGGKGKVAYFTKSVVDRMGKNVEILEVQKNPFGLWSDKRQIALDADSSFRLGVNGFHVKVIETGKEVLVIDIKSGENIHDFTAFETCDMGMKELFRGFSNKEADGVWKLR